VAVAPGEAMRLSNVDMVLSKRWPPEMVTLVTQSETRSSIRLRLPFLDKLEEGKCEGFQRLQALRPASGSI
jgi:hypothetical protein